MLAGTVVEVDAAGDTKRHELGGVAAAIRARQGGGYLLAAENRFVLLRPDLTKQQQFPPVFTDPLIRMNDGGCDPQGRFYCGTMAYDETPGAGTLYRLDSDGSVHVTLRDVTISNGLQWNRAGDTVCYADTPTGRVDRFDFDAGAGAFSRRRTFSERSPIRVTRTGWRSTKRTASGSHSGAAAPCTATTPPVASTWSSNYRCRR